MSLNEGSDRGGRQLKLQAVHIRPAEPGVNGDALFYCVFRRTSRFERLFVG